MFTAHPTEVARRSTIDKLRRVAALLEEPDSPRRTRAIEEAVELLWLTDEIRIEPPEPTDEAISSDGQNLYAGLGRTRQVAIERINADGSLTTLGIVSGMPEGMAGLAAN